MLLAPVVYDFKQCIDWVPKSLNWRCGNTTAKSHRSCEGRVAVQADRTSALQNNVLIQTITSGLNMQWCFTSQEHDAGFLYSCWNLLLLPIAFSISLLSSLLSASMFLPCATSVPNVFLSSKNISSSLHVLHITFSILPFTPVDFHFFSSGFFTQETISLSLSDIIRPICWPPAQEYLQWKHA